MPPSRPTIARIELSPHGEFATQVSQIRFYDRMTKAQLVNHLAECYCDSDYHAARTKVYWRRFPKTILVLVYAGLQFPAN